MKKLFLFLFLLSLPLIGSAQFNEMLLASQQQATTFDLTDLLAEYQLSDATDSYGSYDGTATGMTYSSGKINNAADFDGTDGYITIADNNVFSFTDGAGADEAFTITFWYYMASADEDIELITKDGWTATTREWGIARGSSAWYFFCSEINGTDRIAQNITQTITTSTWVHLAFTYDGLEAHGGMNIYQDGSALTQNGSETGTYTGMSNGTTPVVFGAFQGDLPDTFYSYIGSLDELKIFNRELSASVVSDLFDLENAGTRITE